MSLSYGMQKKPNNRVKEEAKIFLRATDHPEPKLSVEIQTLSSLWSKKRLRERASKRGILSLSKSKAKW